MTPTCTYDAERGWLTPEHARDCNESGCAGCRPCPKSHCGMRSRCANHVEHGAGLFTCPSCIGKTRRRVLAIVDRYAELPAEYEYADINSEVLNLHGPAASPEQWAARRASVVQTYETRGWCDFPKHSSMADDDPHHPYLVLGRWDMEVREIYAQPTDLFITISRAADYLAGTILDTFAHTQEFEDFTRDVDACLAHLEDVLALTRRPELGAPCPTCRVELDGAETKAPRLAKRLAEHHPLIALGATCAVDGCRVCRGDNDTWHCPRNPEHHWDHVSYRDRVDGDYVQHATELPATELADRLGVALSTFRKWTARTWDDDARAWLPARLSSRRKGHDGRKVYPVADALRLAERDSA